MKYLTFQDIKFHVARVQKLPFQIRHKEKMHVLDCIENDVAFFEACEVWDELTLPEELKTGFLNGYSDTDVFR